MNSTAVWTLCSVIGIGALLTGFAAPSSAQDQDGCAVTLSGMANIEAGDGFLSVTNSAACADADDEMAQPQSIPSPSTTSGSGLVGESSEPSADLVMPTPAPTPTAPSVATPSVITNDVLSTETPTGAAPSTPVMPSEKDMVAQFVALLSAGEAVSVPDVLLGVEDAKLSADVDAYLRLVADAMLQVGGDFVINGYASVDGDADVNQRYSWLRAQVVGEALSLKGVSIDRLYVKGHGETTVFGDMAADNRRVTIAVFSGD